jgi:hypothetical protein
LGKKAMTKVKIEITNESGETTVVERELTPVSGLATFNDIEQFTLQIRRELFPELQSELLGQSQALYKKKRKSNPTEIGE